MIVCLVSLCPSMFVALMQLGTTRQENKFGEKYHATIGEDKTGILRDLDYIVSRVSLSRDYTRYACSETIKPSKVNISTPMFLLKVKFLNPLAEPAV